MMIGFVEDEMTLKTTLLLSDPIVIVNTLVSCVTSLEERFQPSFILITIGVTFSTNAKLCCHTNSLLMKHANAPKSINAWVCTIVDLPPFIMMGNKKKVLVLKTRYDRFKHMMHLGSISWSLLKLDILVSLLFWSLGSGISCGASCMLNSFLWTSTNYMG